MNRRDALRSIFTVPAAGGAALAASKTPGKYGRLTVPQARRLGYLPALVTVDGIPAKSCIVVDDTAGYVVEYVRDDGRIQFDPITLQPKTQKRYGAVVFSPNVDR